MLHLLHNYQWFTGSRSLPSVL